MLQFLFCDVSHALVIALQFYDHSLLITFVQAGEGRNRQWMGGRYSAAGKLKETGQSVLTAHLVTTWPCSETSAHTQLFGHS